MISYDILIDMKKPGCLETGYELSQGDKELIEFNVILKNGSVDYIPEGDATIVFKKANNQTESGALIPVGTTYNYKIKGSELSVPGPVLAEIKTYDGETGRATSSRFKFWVKADLANYDTTETGTYIGELEHKIIEANALITELTQSRDQAVQLLSDLEADNFAQSYEINDPLKIPSSAVTYALGQDKIDKSRIIDTLAVTEEGFLPDALIVKDLQDQINEQNNNFAHQNEIITNSYGLGIEVNKKVLSQLKIVGTLTSQITTTGINIGTTTIKPTYPIRDIIITRSSGIVVRANIETNGAINLYPEANLPVGTSFNSTVTYLS